MHFGREYTVDDAGDWTCGHLNMKHMEIPAVTQCQTLTRYRIATLHYNCHFNLFLQILYSPTQLLSV